MSYQDKSLKPYNKDSKHTALDGESNPTSKVVKNSNNMNKQHNLESRSRSKGEEGNAFDEMEMEEDDKGLDPKHYGSTFTDFRNMNLGEMGKDMDFMEEESQMERKPSMDSKFIKRKDSFKGKGKKSTLLNGGNHGGVDSQQSTHRSPRPHIDIPQREPAILNDKNTTYTVSFVAAGGAQGHKGGMDTEMQDPDLVHDKRTNKVCTKTLSLDL